MRARTKAAYFLVAILAWLVLIPVIGYAWDNRQLQAERCRVHSLIRVGQSIVDGQEILRQSGYRFHRDTPTRFLDYQQLLVIIGDPTPSMLDKLCYVVGLTNPLRTESPYVVIAASLDGVITKVD